MFGLTGATGFVGRPLLQAMVAQHLSVIPIARTKTSDPLSGSQVYIVPDLSACPPDILTGCQAVIHCAGRAHRMGEDRALALPAYRAVNVEGTRGVIKAMIAAGVRRIVYLSSIKAGGERSISSHPLCPDDVPVPEDPYGASKLEAEQLLGEYGRRGLIEPVVIRPVLIHGPGAKGNLLKLMEAIRKGRLLPFGAIHNRRSLVGVDNLCEAIITAAMLPWERLIRSPVTHETDCLPIGNPRPQGHIYHVADAGVISTRRLVEVLAEGMGVKPRLVSVPRWLAVGGATLLGKGAVARRIFDDLEVDASAFTCDTGWHPRKTLEDGLREMAADFARGQGKGV